MAGDGAARTPAAIAVVVIPAHNGERYLDAAISSARQQTLREIEIVVVDDRSSDRTGAVAARHVQDDPRVRYVVADVGSAGAARNIGWRSSRAPYVANLDHDDLAEPERLARQVDFLEAHPEVGLVGSFAYLIDGSGRRCANMKAPTDAAEVTNALLTGGPAHVTHSTATFRRSLLEQLGGYRELPGTAVEDYDLFMRIAERSLVANIPEFLGSWRLHDASSSQQLMDINRWNLLMQHSARCRRAGLPDPLEGVGARQLPTDAELEQMGYLTEDLRRGTFGNHLRWAGLHLTTRDLVGARHHLRGARRHLETGSAAERAAYLVVRARVELAVGDVAGFVRASLGALLLDPVNAVGLLARPVLGRTGGAVYRSLPAGGGAAGRWLHRRLVSGLRRFD